MFTLKTTQRNFILSRLPQEHVRINIDDDLDWKQPPRILKPSTSQTYAEKEDDQLLAEYKLKRVTFSGPSSGSKGQQIESTIF